MEYSEPRVLDLAVLCNSLPMSVVAKTLCLWDASVKACIDLPCALLGSISSPVLDSLPLLESSCSNVLQDVAAVFGEDDEEILQMASVKQSRTTESIDDHYVERAYQESAANYTH